MSVFIHNIEVKVPIILVTTVARVTPNVSFS